VNNQLTEDLDGTARLSDIGLRHVQAFNFAPRQSSPRPSAGTVSLPARGTHLLSDELRIRDTVRPAPQTAVFEAAQTLGLDILIDPFVSADRWLDEEEIAATADRLNQAAERAADYGFRVGYHNHTQEFAATFGGRSGFEVFAEQLRDEVTIELDLFWALTAKQDVPSSVVRGSSQGPAREGRFPGTRPRSRSVRSDDARPATGRTG
jgi:hypothetical protein